jgi:hypothetical protein
VVREAPPAAVNFNFNGEPCIVSADVRSFVFQYSKTAILFFIAEADRTSVGV